MRYDPKTGNKYLVADKTSWKDDEQDLGKHFVKKIVFMFFVRML